MVHLEKAENALHINQCNKEITLKTMQQNYLRELMYVIS